MVLRNDLTLTEGKLFFYCSVKLTRAHSPLVDRLTITDILKSMNGQSKLKKIILLQKYPPL